MDYESMVKEIEVVEKTSSLLSPIAKVLTPFIPQAIYRKYIQGRINLLVH